ncbi:hypothetical protein GCM10007387_19720 [Pseudoduganella albidiflava]|uniref:CBM-cenC domain-containing protein n=1 Tax=Pseudoduganella albidiflava TaxID=321983 RepID=A0AA88C5B3_9BURK|nr:hypothetical protein GCM10007387_19720 [Pseudoduganella albidiflava]
MFTSPLPAFSQDICAEECLPKRWVYWHGSLLKKNDANVVEPIDMVAFEKLLKRAKDAGYNGVAMAGGSYGSYVQLLDGYYQGKLTDVLEQAMEISTRVGIELIPVGANPELVSFKRPDLREAFPTTTTYTVPPGADKAVVRTGRGNLIQNPGFDIAGNTDWKFDGPAEGQHGGGALETISGEPVFKLTAKLNPPPVPGPGKHNMTRLFQRVALDPNTAYRLTFNVRSDVFDDPGLLKLQILTESQDTLPVYARGGLGHGTNDQGEFLQYSNTELFKPDAAWRTFNIQFNSGNAVKDGKVPVNIYFGTWDLAKSESSVYIDNVSLREIGVSHDVVRGDKNDLVVTNEAGTVTFTTDDYKLGDHAGGDYAGKALELKSAGIKSQKTLKVKWRQSGEHIFGGGVPGIACPNGDFFDIQNAQWRKIDELFSLQSNKYYKPRYFLYYDEIRIMNWERQIAACPTVSAADYLHHMVRGVQNEVATGEYVETLVWNDMFDPYMNAIPAYYKVNGALFDVACTSSSTDQRCKRYNAQRPYPLYPSTIIVNWTAKNATTDTTEVIVTQKRRDSLAYFRDFRQVIALYYNDDANLTSWLEALNTSTVPLAIEGVMYTTFKQDHGAIEEVAQRIKCSPALGKRWPTASRGICKSVN